METEVLSSPDCCILYVVDRVCILLIHQKMLQILCFESAGFFFVSDKSGAVFFSTTMMRRNKKFQNKPRRIPPFQSETYNYIIASFRNFSASITKQSEKGCIDILSVVLFTDSGFSSDLKGGSAGLW